MKKLLFLLPFILLLGCGHKQKPAVKAKDISLPEVHFKDEVLEGLLDSVGHLPAQPLTDKVAFFADSVYQKSIRPMDSIVSTADLEILKRAARKGVMPASVARRIFHNQAISDSCNTKSIFLTYRIGLIPVVLFEFDKNKHDFNEYAICVGDPGHCGTSALYFFKQNKIIAYKSEYTRFSAGLDFYKDAADGRTVVYTSEEFSEGSGIAWFHYFFYKYDGDKLIPVLNELEEGNNCNSQCRVLWLDANILKTNPLTIKMVYYDQLWGGIPSAQNSPDVVNDSTIVTYKWDEQSKKLTGEYNRSKLSKAQILSHYIWPAEIEPLFMNSYYQTLKLALADKKKRKDVLSYLNYERNYFNWENAKKDAAK